ncbi:MAG: hypothetical protein ACI96W_003436, partial [Paraglaciecola sp.]
LAACVIENFIFCSCLICEDDVQSLDKILY